MDDIDELVNASLERGPQRPKMDRCPYCTQEWHGKPNRLFCQGSHLKKAKTVKQVETVVNWEDCTGGE